MNAKYTVVPGLFLSVFFWIALLSPARSVAQDSISSKLVEDILLRLDSALNDVNVINRKPYEVSRSTYADISRLNSFLKNNMTGFKQVAELKLLLTDFAERSTRYEEYLRDNPLSENSGGIGVTSFQNRLVLYHTDLLEVKTVLLALRNNNRLYLNLLNQISISNQNLDSSRFKLALNLLTNQYNEYYQQILLKQIDSSLAISFNSLNARLQLKLDSCCQKKEISGGSSEGWGSQHFYAGAGAWQHTIFSAFINYRLSKGGAPTPFYAGLEGFISADENHSGNAGLFLNMGWGAGRVLIEAGIGTLELNERQESISWKAGMSYLLRQMAIGLNYSPLMGVGLKLGMVWRHR